jgi:photosystem II stability/assembly factor-like uncharacterized protein
MARYAPIMGMREMALQTVGRTTAFLVAALAGSFGVSCQANPTGPTPRPSATTGTAQRAEWSGSLLTLHMITATIGWGEAFEPPLTPGPLVKRLVLRTADGGHHWQNVTPPALSAQMAGELPREYLDQDRAFVMALAGPGQIRVMRTSDGGTHWQDTILRDPKVVDRLSETGSAQFSFVDANHGWLFVSYGYDGDEAGAVYKTIDGGRQWSVASRTDPNKGGGSAIPWQGAKTGITFVDQRNGWLTAATYRSKPLLYVTRDAGTSWSQVAYPDVPGIDMPGGHAVSRPRFFSPTSGEFEVLAGNSVVYTTTDSGASWRPSVSPGCCEFFFLDVNTGWALGSISNPYSKSLFGTSDSGQHWRVVHLHLDEQTQSEISQHFVTNIESLHFVNSAIGYILRDSGQPVLAVGPTPTPSAQWSQSLLRTMDGGATWTEVRSVSS